MTKEKQAGDIARWMVYILIALLFGAFLGSPVPDAWADRISGMISEISGKEIKSESLHSKASAYNYAILADRMAVFDKTADDNVIAGLKTAPGKKTVAVSETAETGDAEAGENEAKTGTATESGVRIIVSDPTTEELSAEIQPDYIISGANRGGTADRKELDVLIHLINAEAYGLSYKAKVAVGQVVMNRWTGPHYGDDLMAIMTAPYQFTPIHNGSAYKKKIEPDSIQAANAVLSGAGVKELTDDTYYFVNPDFTEDKTIETKMQFVCEIEGLHFFRPPAK